MNTIFGKLGDSTSQKTGVDFIEEERNRQIEKGYILEHDQGETAFQLSSAAALFICNAQNIYFRDYTHYDDKGDVVRFQVRELETKKWSTGWPWDDHDGRNKSGIMESLVKAGALIAAEIDRLQNL